MGQRPKCGSPQIIYLTKGVKEYIAEMVLTGLYGSDQQDVCEKLVFRGIEETIVKGIIRHRSPKRLK
jgi:hypothetical protein